MDGTASDHTSKNMPVYVNYGCGFTAPANWLNYDASPSLLIQNKLLLNLVFGRFLRTKFPPNTVYGNILKGLPKLGENSCRGIYCSHVLEHFSLEDMRLALRNTYKILKPGGIFRCVVPDLESAARKYIANLQQGDATASIQFLQATMLGEPKNNTGIRDWAVSTFVQARHLWMWDKISLTHELGKAGFVRIRPCEFNDCEDETFKNVEEWHRFQNSVAIECRK